MYLKLITYTGLHRDDTENLSANAMQPFLCFMLFFIFSSLSDAGAVFEMTSAKHTLKNKHTAELPFERPTDQLIA